MIDNLTQALAAGSRSIVAWADILDRINVFPIPDGDTGRNLVMTLSPLRQPALDLDKAAERLLLAARGNSGNIAARFLSGLLACRDLARLPEDCARGRDLAYEAVPDPKPGTILTLFDALVDALNQKPPAEGEEWVHFLLNALEDAVRATTQSLPELKEAGVVDSGALGMFIFFDSFFSTLIDREVSVSRAAEAFRGFLDLTDNWRKNEEQGYCLDVVLEVGQVAAGAVNRIYDLGESVVALSDGQYLKVHLHTGSQEMVRENLESMGRIVRWSADDLAEQTAKFSGLKVQSAIHVMTDAAGSITRADAAALGITLLDSYINVGHESLPETYLPPAALFEAMRGGVKVSTSQASIMERHQCYRKALDLYPRVLYICVGSVFTTNYQVALDWKTKNDPEDRLIVLDSGSASGRLGLAARAVAQLALETTDPEKVIAFARRAVAECREYLFLDKLQYLAAGGRLSKTSAFFGDVLQMKPVVSPLPQGAEKVAVVRTRAGQVQFAFDRLKEALAKSRKARIMLEYTDNTDWLLGEIKPEIERRFPWAELLVTPMSLTSSAHMGPGTWGVAFLKQYDMTDWKDAPV
ncbi:MAG: DegV family protein [Thermodesulfobacteriota bacterium]